MALGSGADSPSQSEQHRLIVGFEDPQPDIREGDEVEGYPVVFTAPDGDFAVVLADDLEIAKEEIREEDDVDYVERDRVDHAHAFTPNDPLYPDQYAPAQVDLPEAWGVGLTSGAERPVCFVDSGVRYTHEDLAGDRWQGGYDFVNDDGDPWDDYGHGTSVTGVAAAGLDNGVGVAGTGNLDFHHMKVLSDDGSGWHSWTAAGITECSQQGDVVISISLGGSHSQTKHDAVRDAWQDGDLLVASAGNEGPCYGCLEDNHPGAYPEVVAVTCTDSDRELCSFSSTGPEAELAAPGYSIKTTDYGDDAAYDDKYGTSSSAPRVAGAAALLWSRTPSLSNEDVRTLLRNGAEDMGPEGHDNAYGYGELDVDDSIPPLEPRNIETVGTAPDEVLLAWDPPSDTGASPVRHYEVYRGHVGDPLQLVGTTEDETPSFRDRGLHVLQPQQYRYAVRAVNDAGPGAISEEVCGGGLLATFTALVDGATREVCERGDRYIPGSVRATTDTPERDPSLIAASGTGDAYACHLEDGAISLGCMAVSGTGDAEGDQTAISGTGNASSDALTVGGQNAEGNPSLALALLGDADSCGEPDDVISLDCAAISAAGDARGDALAVSGVGDASSDGVAVAVVGYADGFVAFGGCNEYPFVCENVIPYVEDTLPE